MADMKIPPGGQLPAVRPNPPRAEAVRNAQQAFFQAAMGQAGAPAPKARPQAAPQPAAAPVADAPQRYARPGSRLDIKV